MKTLIDGDVTFAYLGIDDVEFIEARIRADREDALTKQWDVVKDVAPAQRAQMLAQVQTVTVDDIYFYVRNVRAGIIATLKAAAKKAGNESVTLTYDLPNAGNLAAHLFGLENRVPTSPKVEAPKNPTQAG